MADFSRFQSNIYRRTLKWLAEEKKGIAIAGLILTLGPLLTFALSYALRPQGSASPEAFELKTTAFKHGGDIPKKYTCEGPNVSPPLSWGIPPAGTQSFALIMDDPDAPMGTWVHWVAYDLPAAARQLPESVPKGDELQGGGRQGRNDFPEIGYGGPCPPPGKPHRYFFKLYALDRKLDLKPGATKQEVEGAIEGHVLGKAELIGRYRR